MVHYLMNNLQRLSKCCEK